MKQQRLQGAHPPRGKRDLLTTGLRSLPSTTVRQFFLRHTEDPRTTTPQSLAYPSSLEGIEEGKNDILPRSSGLRTLSRSHNTARPKPVHKPAKDPLRYEAGTSALSYLGLNV